MTKMTNGYEKRKHSRLKTYDYTNSGCYFITFCTKDRAHVLSSIVGRGALTPPRVELTNIGKIAAEVIERTSVVYPGISIDNYVIMPNHIHVVIRLNEGTGGQSRPPLQRLIQRFKSITTRRGWEMGRRKLWQRSYYDHVIRCQEDYIRICEYINNNPAKWAEDEYYYAE